MNLSIPELVVIVLIGLFVQWQTKSALFALFPIAVIVFPTARVFVGFPVYVYDILAVLILVSYRRELRTLPWSLLRIPWPYVFGCLIVVCGLAWPVIVYGPQLPIFWIAAHAIIAYSAFAIGAVVTGDDRFRPQRMWLGYGTLAGLTALAFIGAVQFGSPEASTVIVDFFYRDLESETSMRSEFVAAMLSERAAGAHGSPNGLGVVAALCMLLVSVLLRRRLTTAVAMAAGTVAVMSSVSRQAMLALAFAAAVYAMFSGSEKRTGLVVIGSLVLPLFVGIFLASPFADTVFERFSRWSEGVGEDEAFQARYVDGPARMAQSIEEFPSIVIFGTGPDVQKLKSYGVDTANRDYGFLSISYALFFFQYGVLGLLAGVWMHLQGFFHLRFVPKDQRAGFAALLASIVIYYAADNTPNISESVTSLCLISIGLVSGFALQVARERTAKGPLVLPPGLRRMAD